MRLILGVVAVVGGVLCIVTEDAWAQLAVVGPGIEPAPPVEVVVNPPASVLGLVAVRYTFINQGTLPLDVFPFLECPPDTVRADIDTTPFTLAPSASAQVEASFSDLLGGATVGDVVVCTLDGGTQEIFEVSLEIIGVDPFQMALITTLTMKSAVQSPSEEATVFLFDLQSNLQLQLLTGGLVFNTDVGVGTTGLEFAILGFGVPFDQLALRTDLVFASPFNKFLAAIGPTLFATARLRATLNLPEISLDALLLLDDIHFPDPTTSTLTTYPDPADPETEQEFVFGTILSATLNPELLGGVKLTQIVGLCADPQGTKAIKKRSFLGRVDCRQNALGVTVEKILLEGLAFDTFGFSGLLDFRPEGTAFTITTGFPLLDIATGQFTLQTGDITSLIFNLASLNMRADLLSHRMIVKGGLHLNALAPAPIFTTGTEWHPSGRLGFFNTAELMPVQGGVKVTKTALGLSLKQKPFTITHQTTLCIPTSDLSKCRIPESTSSSDALQPIALQSNQTQADLQLQSLAGGLEGKLSLLIDFRGQRLNKAQFIVELSF